MGVGAYLIRDLGRKLPRKIHPQLAPNPRRIGSTQRGVSPGKPLSPGQGAGGEGWDKSQEASQWSPGRFLAGPAEEMTIKWAIWKLERVSE